MLCEIAEHLSTRLDNKKEHHEAQVCQEYTTAMDESILVPIPLCLPATMFNLVLLINP